MNRALKVQPVRMERWVQLDLLVLMGQMGRLEPLEPLEPLELLELLALRDLLVPMGRTAQLDLKDLPVRME